MYRIVLYFATFLLLLLEISFVYSNPYVLNEFNHGVNNNEPNNIIGNPNDLNNKQQMIYSTQLKPEVIEEEPVIFDISTQVAKFIIYFIKKYCKNSDKVTDLENLLTTQGIGSIFKTNSAGNIQPNYARFENNNENNNNNNNSPRLEIENIKQRQRQGHTIYNHNFDFDTVPNYELQTSATVTIQPEATKQNYNIEIIPKKTPSFHITKQYKVPNYDYDYDTIIERPQHPTIQIKPQMYEPAYDYGSRPDEYGIKTNDYSLPEYDLYPQVQPQPQPQPHFDTNHNQETYLIPGQGPTKQQFVEEKPDFSLESLFKEEPQVLTEQPPQRSQINWRQLQPQEQNYDNPTQTTEKPGFFDNIMKYLEPEKSQPQVFWSQPTQTTEKQGLVQKIFQYLDPKEKQQFSWSEPQPIDPKQPESGFSWIGHTTTQSGYKYLDSEEKPQMRTQLSEIQPQQPQMFWSQPTQTTEKPGYFQQIVQYLKPEEEPQFSWSQLQPTDYKLEPKEVQVPQVNHEEPLKFAWAGKTTTKPGAYKYKEVQVPQVNYEQPLKFAWAGQTTRKPDSYKYKEVQVPQVNYEQPEDLEQFYLSQPQPSEFHWLGPTTTKSGNKYLEPKEVNHEQPEFHLYAYEQTTKPGFKLSWYLPETEKPGFFDETNREGPSPWAWYYEQTEKPGYLGYSEPQQPELTKNAGFFDQLVKYLDPKEEIINGHKQQKQPWFNWESTETPQETIMNRRIPQMNQEHLGFTWSQSQPTYEITEKPGFFDFNDRREGDINIPTQSEKPNFFDKLETYLYPKDEPKLQWAQYGTTGTGTTGKKPGFLDQVYKYFEPETQTQIPQANQLPQTIQSQPQPEMYTQPPQIVTQENSKPSFLDKVAKFLVEPEHYLADVATQTPQIQQQQQQPQGKAKQGFLDKIINYLEPEKTGVSETTEKSGFFDKIYKYLEPEPKDEAIMNRNFDQPGFTTFDSTTRGYTIFDKTTPELGKHYFYDDDFMKNIQPQYTWPPSYNGLTVQPDISSYNGMTVQPDISYNWRHSLEPNVEPQEHESVIKEYSFPHYSLTTLGPAQYQYFKPGYVEGPSKDQADKVFKKYYNFIYKIQSDRHAYNKMSATSRSQFASNMNKMTQILFNWKDGEHYTDMAYINDVDKKLADLGTESLNIAQQNNNDNDMKSRRTFDGPEQLEKYLEENQEDFNHLDDVLQNIIRTYIQHKNDKTKTTPENKVALYELLYIMKVQMEKYKKLFANMGWIDNELEKMSDYRPPIDFDSINFDNIRNMYLRGHLQTPNLNFETDNSKLFLSVLNIPANFQTKALIETLLAGFEPISSFQRPEYRDVKIYLGKQNGIENTPFYKNLLKYAVPGKQLLNKDENVSANRRTFSDSEDDMDTESQSEITTTELEETTTTQPTQPIRQIEKHNNVFRDFLMNTDY